MQKSTYSKKYKFNKIREKKNANAKKIRIQQNTTSKKYEFTVQPTLTGCVHTAFMYTDLDYTLDD